MNEDQNKEDRSNYNYVDFQYHINNYKLNKICNILGISMKEYYDICKRLNQPITTQKVLIKIDDTMHFKEKDLIDQLV